MVSTDGSRPYLIGDGEFHTLKDMTDDPHLHNANLMRNTPVILFTTDVEIFVLISGRATLVNEISSLFGMRWRAIFGTIAMLSIVMLEENWQ